MKDPPECLLCLVFANYDYSHAFALLFESDMCDSMHVHQLLLIYCTFMLIVQ